MQKTIRKQLATIAAFILAVTCANAQTYLPKSYYTFENATTPMKDSMGFFNLDPSYYGSGYTISNNTSGGVGRYMTLDSSGNMIRGGVLAVDTALTFEFIFKPGYYFNTTVFFRRLDGAIEARMQYPQIEFVTNVKAYAGGYIFDDFIINLDGIGRKSYGYYIDGNWHHIVFKYNAKTGEKQIWIDGQLPAGFSKTLASGYFEATGNREYHFDSGTNYYKYHGGIDEVAVYYYALPDNMIYKHYQNITANTHYQFANSTTPVPSPSPVSGSVSVNEYAPGHPNPTLTPIEQLKNFPVPRYKPGHTMYPINPFVGYHYLSGYNTYASSYAAAVANSKVLQTDFANNFNYMFLATENTGEFSEFGDTTRFSGAWIKLANQNPQWKISALTYWPQLHPSDIGKTSSSPYVSCQCLPNNYYLRNSSGSYLNPNGGTGSTKYISPAAPSDSLVYDGQTQKYYLQQLLNKLTRPLDYVFENGEVIPFLYYSNVMTQDPSVVTDKNASGLDWFTYEGRRAATHIKSYRDQFMNGLSGLSNSKFAYYQLDGQNQWNFKWSEVRSVNTPMNGFNYATGDIYVRWPNNWRNWTSAWHGWQWVVESRHEQLASGDKYFSPAVSPGWDNNEEVNVRPAQWLGFLKAVSMLGAEFFTTGYFVTSAPYQNPKNYIWQLAIPPYAQAITSRYEDLFRNGTLMSGDVPNSTSNPQWMAYNFFTGDPRKLVVIRKHNSITKYAITGTIQPSSNMDGAAELEGTAKIKLDGNWMQFKVRRQGSTYIYDNSNTSAPVFYQLDGWHETTHPYYWTKDFSIEGENFDNTNASLTIKTRRPAGAAAGDYTSFTSSVVFNAATDVVYNFQPRSTTNNNYYFWVLARSTNGTLTGMNITLDGGNAKQIGCITDTNWVWYKYNVSDGLAIVYNGITSGVNHALRVTSTNAFLEIDKILLTTSSGSVYPTPSPCSSVTIPTITPGGATTFCQGGSVTLTASSGNSYLWSNGSTTQSINVSVSGSYLVTVTTASGNATSAPMVVSVNALPTASITAGGSTAICPGSSVTLTASSGSSYLWTPGNQTTQSITATAAGSYTVRVTNSNGCSKTSSATAITMNTAPTATITAGGSTTFCSGGSVALTASSGSAYLWSPGNQTTQSITATAAGSYTVRVTNASGCSATSAATTITVNSLPTSTITAGGSTTFCSGGSVALTASSGSAYLWSPGNQTTQSITATAAGSYTVRVTNASGCSATSIATNVTINSLPTATITASGPLTFAQGGSVTLTASSGSSYLWLPGNQTTQSINVTASGSYTVRVTNAAGCSATSAATTVTVTTSVPAPKITAGGPLSFCSGGSVTLTCSAANSYLWSTGATTQSIVVSTSGTYTVTATTAAGTATSTPVIVTVTSPPTALITASGSTALCQGSSVTLTAASANSYTWSTGATTQNITVSAAGNYSVTVTNTSGCSATSAATAVTVSSAPAATITAGGATTFCSGGSVTLTASTGSTYLWSPGNQTTKTITVTAAGSYTVRVTNSSGCSATSSATTVTVNALPPANITASGPTTFTQGGSVILTASSGSSYLWSPGNQTSQSITVTSGGSYTVRVTNANGCSATSAATIVTVNTGTTATITPSGATTFCQGGSVTLTASIGTGYLWSNGQTTQSIAVTQSGTYTVTVYNGVSSNSVSAPVTVTVNPSPSATITAGSATSFCSGGNVVLTATSGSSYLWLPGNQTSQAITVTATGSYTVRVTNSSGCSATSTATTVTVNNCSGTCTYPGGRYTSNITNSSAELHWNLIPVDSFYVRLRNMNTGAYYYTSALSNQINSITLGVNAGTSYRWNVRSKCGTIKSSWSPYTAFTTPSLRQAPNPTSANNFVELEEGFDDEELQLVNEISANTPLNDFNLYPNPTSEIANVSLKSSFDSYVKIEVKDFAGRIIYTVAGDVHNGLNIFKINIGSLAKGTYLISVISAEINATKKLNVN